MSSTRQLAAILFTDIVGYTNMMQTDEQKAVTVLKHYTATLLKWVTKHEGRVANDYGDGSLCVFNSATAAVLCAMDIQNELRQEPIVPLRVGLHIGEVIIEDEKTIGDGVNVASRIQSLGQANSILVSAEIHDKIRNNPTLPCVSLGFFDFKNVHHSHEVFALATEGLIVPKRNTLRGKVKSKTNFVTYTSIFISAMLLVLILSGVYRKFFLVQKSDVIEKSIAVLPFTDMSQAGDQEYFSDGLTEDIITQLAKITAFKVTSRTSVMKYKNPGKSIKEISGELGANFILEGSVQQSGTQVRINAQLINAATDEHLWAEKYDRGMQDIFSIQSEIATAIADALQASLSAKEQQYLSKQYTDNTEAYQLYLQGRFYWNQREAESILKSIGFFRQAIAQDSNYALAYSGLGDAYLMLGVYSVLPPAESFPVAKSYVNRALQLDPLLAEAHATMIDIHIHYDWDIAAADSAYQKAIALNPEEANAYHWFSEVYDMRREFDKAIEQSHIALEHEPYSLIINSQMGTNLLYAGKKEEAKGQFLKTIGYDSTFAIAHYYLGIIYTNSKEYEKGIDHFQKAAKNAPGRTRFLAALGWAQSMSGNSAAANQIHAEMVSIEKTKYVAAYDKAVFSLGLKNQKITIGYLEEAYNHREPWMPFIDMNPMFESLHGDPEFERLVNKINTPN